MCPGASAYIDPAPQPNQVGSVKGAHNGNDVTEAQSIDDVCPDPGGGRRSQGYNRHLGDDKEGLRLQINDPCLSGCVSCMCARRHVSVRRHASQELDDVETRFS